jgi:type VI protein secretion system component VasK
MDRSLSPRGDETAAERARTAAAMQQCDYLASEILSERARHARELAAEHERARAAAAAAHDEAERLQHQLAHALAVIKDMERSRFWRMRNAWVGLTRLFRRVRS